LQQVPTPPRDEDIKKKIIKEALARLRCGALRREDDHTIMGRGGPEKTANSSKKTSKDVLKAWTSGVLLQNVQLNRNGAL